MAQLMVRNVDDAVVQELKKRAARRNLVNRSIAEILEQLLLRPSCRSLAEVWRRCRRWQRRRLRAPRQIDPRTYPVNATCPRRHRFLAHGSNRLHRS